MRKLGMTASVLLVLFLILPIIPSMAKGQELSVSNVEPFQSDIYHEITKGKTRELGGGEFIKINFGKDSSNSLIFIYGTREIKAPITVISRGVEIAGYNVLSNMTTEPVKSEVVTIYRLENLVEFEDANKNNLYDSGATVSNVDAETDRIIKALSLSLAWSYQQTQPRRTKDGIEWSFTLEARNVSYTRTLVSTVRPAVSADRASAFVENIRFVFHISVSSTKETRMLIDLERNAAPVVSSLEGAHKRFELQKINVTTKMDHMINGWDFAPDNKKPALMLKFSLHMGRTFDTSIIKDIDDPLRSRIFGDPSVGIGYSDQPFKTIWNEYRNEPLLSSLDTKGNGYIRMVKGSSDLSEYFWTDKVLEMNREGGRTLRSNLQISNISWRGPRDGIWNNGFFKGRLGLGVSVHGGFTYPRALNIHHDPGIQTFGWSVIEKKEEKDDPAYVIPGVPLTTREASVLLIILAIVALVGVAIISSLTRRRFYQGDEELLREEEEEVFVVKTRKRDWDKLRPK